ncbi:hypothetical protein E2Q89_20955 [Escherichia coli]|nr:hypothetical protein [Escherichia coli]
MRPPASSFSSSALVSASARMRSTFGSSFRAFRSSLDIDSSLFALPDATLTRSYQAYKTRLMVNPTNRAPDRAPGE